MKMLKLGLGLYGAIIVAWAWAAQVETNETLLLGTTKLLGREVPIIIPKSEGIIDLLQLKPEQKNILSHDGWKYLVVDGQPVMRFVEKGGWSDVPTLYQEAQKRIAQGGSVEWKVKCFILSRVEILDVGADGIGRLRRGRLSKQDLDRALEQLATFKALVEAGTKGHLKIKLDVELDDSAVRTMIFPDGLSHDQIPEFLAGREIDKAKGSLKPESTWKTIEESVQARINKEPFDADDRVDRGPFDTVFILHSGLTRKNKLEVGGRSLYFQNLFNHPRSEVPFGLSLDLFSAWLHDLRQNAVSNGFQLAYRSDLIQEGFPAQMVFQPEWDEIYRVAAGIKWQNLSTKRSRTQDEEYLSRLSADLGKGDFSWEEIQLEPLAKLPHSVINTNFSKKEDASLVGTWKDNGTLSGAVDLAFMDLIVANLRPNTKLRFQKASSAQKNWVYFELSETVIGSLPMLNNGLRVHDEKANAASWNQVLAKLPEATGYAKLERGKDPQKGDLVTLVEPEAVRWGSIQLFSGSIPAGSKSLRFWLKSNHNEPVALNIFNTSSNSYKSILLVGVDRWPSEEQGRPTPQKPLLAGDSPEWREIQISISKDLLPGLSSEDFSKTYLELRLGTNPQGTCFERTQLEPSRATVAGLRFSEEEVAKQPESTDGIQTPSDEAKLVWSWAFEPSELSKKRILEALKNTSDPLHLSALVALAHGPALLEAEPLLIALSKGGSGFAAELAIRSLAKIDTVETRSWIKNAAEKGPTEANRRAAATFWPESLTDLRSVPVLSSLLTSRDWRARKAAADRLSRIKTKEAAILLLTFLQDVDPLVRLAVLQGANLELEIVNQRVLYYAVNDPYEAIRAICYQQLLNSPLAEYRKEGYKGIRDDSLYVRLALIQKMAENPKPEYREAIRAAITARESKVRAAALQALMKQPGEVQLAEVQNILQEKHPMVQMAFLELVKVKKLSLPDSAIQKFKASTASNVAAKAKEIWP